MWTAICSTRLHYLQIHPPNYLSYLKILLVVLRRLFTSKGYWPILQCAFLWARGDRTLRERRGLIFAPVDIGASAWDTGPTHGVSTSRPGQGPTVSQFRIRSEARWLNSKDGGSSFTGRKRKYCSWVDALYGGLYGWTVESLEQRFRRFVVFIILMLMLVFRY